MKASTWIIAGAAAIILLPAAAGAGQAPAASSSGQAAGGGPAPTQKSLLATLAGYIRRASLAPAAASTGAGAGSSSPASSSPGAAASSSKGFDLQAWIQQQKEAGKSFIRGLAAIGMPPYSTHASSGFGSDAFKQLEVADLGGTGIKIQNLYNS